MSETRIVYVCFCGDSGRAHIHLPPMMDSQYGLPVVIGTSELCRKCNGRGTIRISSALRSCPNCDGEGRM